MSASDPRIVVHGAGSIGCWLGGTWIAAGLPVTLLGRQSVQAEIKQHGLRLTDYAGWERRLTSADVPVTTSAKALAEADVIALTVKSTATDAAAREIAKHARPGTTVISFQNGVSNPERLRKALPAYTVLHGMVPFNVARLGDGRWHKGTNGDFYAEDHPITQRLAARIGDRPGKLQLSPNMLGVAWGKLIINLNNAVNALSGKTLLEQLSERDYRRVVAASQAEALDLLKAAGIEPVQSGPLPPKLVPVAVGAPDFVFRNLVLRVQKIDPHARSSMADDFRAGRPTEIDVLNGEVVVLARRLGREAPVNAAIVALVKQAEAGVVRAWDSGALWAHIRKVHRPRTGFGF